MRVQIKKTNGHYHHRIKITWGVHRFIIAWRWYPLIMWRYFPRAWQGFPPAGTTMATDWTGRDREVMGVVWHVDYTHYTVHTNPDPATLEFVA